MNEQLKNILDIINIAKKDKTKNKWKDLGYLTNKEIERVKKIMDIDITMYIV